MAVMAAFVAALGAALAFAPASAARGSARVHRPMLPTSAASRVVSVETPSAGEPRAFKGLRRRLLEWRPAQRAAVSVALGASVIFGGARPSFARDSPQPLEHTVEVEQLFLKKKWDRQSCENAGIKVDEIVAKVAWSDMPVGEAQREMFDIVDADLSEDSDRVLGIVTFIGVSSVGVAITTDLFKRFDRHARAGAGRLGALTRKQRMREPVSCLR